MDLPKVEEVEKGSRLSEIVPDKSQSVGRMQDEILVLIHELRGPLAAIRNALQVSRQCGEDAATREWAQSVLERQTNQMGCLIDRLLDLSRLRRGKWQLQKSSVNLTQLISLAVETVRSYIDERGHVLEVILPTAPVIVDADSTWMQQLFTNLLMNAIKYTEPGGRIWLTAAFERDEVVLRVRDSGIGIAAEALPNLFDLFWQSSPADGRSQIGLGIGLALVRQIAEMHGGCVSAFSAGPDQGSEFVVHLPCIGSPGKHTG